MAFAATENFTNAGQVNFTFDGTTVSSPYILDGQDSGNTTAFAPIYYFDQLLNKAGITATWNGNTHTWALSDSSIDASKVNVAGGVGTGNTTITLNGTTIKKINTYAAQDPAAKAGQMTTYFPVYYVQTLFQAIGIDATWNGTTGLSVGTAAATASFTTPVVSGNKEGNGTAGNPAVSTGGAALDVKTVLNGSNGAPLANTAVTVTLSGTAGDTPVIEANGSYVTPNPNSSNDTWTATVDTDSNGQIDLSVVGTGSYTVSFQAPYSNNGTAVTSSSVYLAYLGANGLLSVANSSPDISTVSNPATGVTPVTFTLPLDSSGDVQTDKAVTFFIPQGEQASFTTSGGQAIGSTDSSGNKYVTVYSDSNGQATVYVNDFTAEPVNVYAEVGTTPYSSSSTSYASASLGYTDPNASTSVTLGSIAVYPFASSLSAAPGTSAPTSISGIPSTMAAYFEPVDTSGNLLSGSSLAQTFTLAATNGATIGLEVTDGSGNLQPVTLPNTINADSNLVLEVKSDGSNYDWYANGLEIATGSKNTEFAVTLGAGSSNPASSTLTVTSGGATATAGFTFSGSTAVKVTNFAPVFSNIGAAGTATTVTFTAEDGSGDPVANQLVKVALPAPSVSTEGVWITGIDGTQLSEAIGNNGATVYTPIPLGNDETVNYSVGIPNLVTWGNGENYIDVYTNASGQASITFQNGDVLYAKGDGSTTTPYANTVDTNSVSSGNLFAFTPSAAANEGVLEFVYGATSATATFTASGSATPTASQTGQIQF